MTSLDKPKEPPITKEKEETPSVILLSKKLENDKEKIEKYILANY